MYVYFLVVGIQECMCIGSPSPMYIKVSIQAGMCV